MGSVGSRLHTDQEREGARSVDVNFNASDEGIARVEAEAGHYVDDAEVSHTPAELT